MSEPPLTKVRVSLPNLGLLRSEGLWARSVGNELYELLNVPFAAYGLNRGDVVHASRQEPHQDPEIDRVVRRGGHTTYRLLFLKSTSARRQDQCLAPLRALGVTAERADKVFYALNVPPQANPARVRQLLDTLVDLGVVLYESTEERQPGSFDAPARAGATPTIRLVPLSRSFNFRPR